MCAICDSKVEMTVEENPNGPKAPPINSVSVMGAQHKFVAASRCSSESSSSDEDDGVLTSYENCGLETQEPTVNVVNSREVVIGSVTQFHGPVTIVQHGDTTKVPALKDKQDELRNNGANLVTSEGVTTEKVYMRKCIPKRILVCFACITLLIGIITLVLVYSLSASVPDIPQNVTERPEYETIGSHTLFLRAAWGAYDAKSIVNMTHPAQYVIISHTVTPVCNSVRACSETLRNIQSFHVGRSYPDIGYNFLIGGDGNIYEGRGWDRKNFHEDRSVGICFIGNYMYHQVTPEMEDALVQLLKLGVEKKVLMPNYRLIGHNQTMATQSPGVNVYKFIKTLPHFYPDRSPESRVR